MYVLVFNNKVSGFDAILSKDQAGFEKHLSCYAYINQDEIDKCLVREEQGVRVSYIGEDVLYQFKDKDEQDLLEVLGLLVDVAKSELNQFVANRLSQKLLQQWLCRLHQVRVRL